MVSVLDLPSELAVEIFHYLSPNETHYIINQIKHPKENDHVRDTHHDNVQLLDLLYQRLYNGKLSIVNNDPKDRQQADTLHTVNSFEEIFIVNNYENNLFQETRPRSVEINFSRRANDYKQFIDNMYEFNLILEKDCNPLIMDYFAKIQQVSFYADGNLMMVENPATLSTIIIKILINLTESSLSSNLQRISIKSFDIGSFYVSKWSQLFRNFDHLQYLDLSNNLIRSLDDACVDVMGLSFKFPPKLKVLILDGNSIKTVSANFVRNLPSSIEALLLNMNLVASLGVDERLHLDKYLPNIRLLRLNHNNRLIYINPSSFEELLAKSLTIELKACNVTPENIIALKGASRKLTIMI